MLTLGVLENAHDIPPSEPKSDSSLRFWILLSGVGVISLFGWAHFSHNSNPLEKLLRPPGLSSVPGGAADYDWSIRALNGKPFYLAGARGKVLFINFWATWCFPCRLEMPGIQRLYDRFKDNPNILFLILSSEEPPVVSKFIKKNHYTFPVYTYEAVPPIYVSEGIPVTFIVSPDGRMAASHEGAARWDSKDATDFIESLLKTASPGKNGSGPGGASEDSAMSVKRFLQAGQTLVQERRYPAAAALYRLALQRYPEDIELEKGLALALENSGEHSAAEALQTEIQRQIKNSGSSR